MPSASRRLSKNSQEELPEFSARLVDEDDGDHVALAGLEEREDFEPFVEGAEAAGEESDGVALFDEHQLAREEVFHVHELGVAGDDRVGRLLEGEHDVEAHRVFAAGAEMAGFHDAAGGAGDDEPADLGHGAAEFDGLLVAGFVGAGAGGAEDGDFAARAVRRKNLEGVAQFAHGAAENFQVAAGGLVGGELVGRFFDLLDEVGDALTVETF